jgi:dipeptide/tripeptide permease
MMDRGASAGAGASTPIDHNALEQGWLWCLKISVYAGIEWGKTIYTTKVLILAGLVNGAVAAVALPILAGAKIVYLVKEREIKSLELLKNHLVQKQAHSSYQIPAEARQAIDAFALKLPLLAKA